MMKKNFANRIILNFTLVVVVGFLTVYFLFNSVMDNHIRAEAEAELDREIMMVNEIEFFPNFPVIEWRGNSLEDVQFFIGSVHSNRAIVNVDTIIINNNEVILHPNPLNLSEIEAAQIEALANFWHNNQSLFEANDDMIMATHAGHTFYMRATPHYIIQPNLSFLETVPVYVIVYTDITPAMNLKNSMNQILLVLLAISGALTLIISIILQARFKRSIKRLSIHADIIGQGNFDEKIEEFNYAEFNHLGGSMTNMAGMLGAYESNQKQFFQNASHELRTPLMSIQGYAEGLQSGVFEDSDATAIILEESQKMTELVDDILYLSKLNTSENSQLNLTSFNVNTLIASASARIKIIAEKSNKQIIMSSSADIEIQTDKDKLERTIINILSNAIRYAKSEIHINSMVENNQLNIVITNDGPPIDEIDLPHIFDRFYKGSSGNTGLGLAITKDLIMRLRGTVHAINLEFGVKFVICLPLK